MKKLISKLVILIVFLVILLNGLNYINDLDHNVKTLAIENSESDTRLYKLLEDTSGLVNVSSVDKNMIIDMRYATTKNGAKKKLYPGNVCLLRKETAAKLEKANAEFMQKGYRIKIWDAYRPLSAQKELWNVEKDRNFVASPVSGSKHNRGAAVDITLVDKNGTELEMPSDFDDFTQKAYRDNKNISAKAKENITYLADVMKKYGFEPLNSEWWHFTDTDWEKYPLLDIKLDYFVKK